MLANRTDTACMYACMAAYLAYQALRLTVGLAAVILAKPNPAWLNRLFHAARPGEGPTYPLGWQWDD